jgi:hypothetical protein
MSSVASNNPPLGGNGPRGQTWQMSGWKCVSLLASLPLVALSGAWLVTSAALVLLSLAAMNPTDVFRGLLGSFVSFALFAVSAEAWVVAAGAFHLRPASLRIGADEFDHFQLKTPISLSSIRTLTIHRVKASDVAVTITADRPIALRFVSPFNIAHLLSPSRACRTFTFLPGLVASGNRTEIINELVRAVVQHGGQIVRR